MELDEFKKHTYHRFNPVFLEKSPAELETMLHRRVSSVVEQIKRSIRLEILAALLFIIFTGYVLLYSPGYIKLIAFLTLCFCLVFLGYFINLHKRINAYYGASLSVRENAEQLIEITRKFIRLYFQVTMVFVPMIFLLVFFAMAANQQYFPGSITSARIFVFTTASLAWCILMYYFTRWYVHILYGKYLQNLKGHLSELQNPMPGHELNSA